MYNSASESCNKEPLSNGPIPLMNLLSGVTPKRPLTNAENGSDKYD